MKTIPTKILHQLFVIILLIFPGHHIWSQSVQILSDTAFKYFIGNSEPDKNWNTLHFDDSGWQTGYHSIGYGDGDDTTIINHTTSVYTRIPFNVENKDKINGLVLILDFDDGFVASVNGIEFARVNMGAFGSETTYDQLSDRSHEAEIYRHGYGQGMVLGYYIDDTIVSNHLTNGVNILSIEVHNDSVNGGDLSLNYGLLNLDGFYNIYNFVSRYKRSVELDSTELPIIKIETNEFGIPYKRIEVKGKIEIINNGLGKYNKPVDPISGYSGPIEIEQRGESSADFPKKSYNFETQDEDGNDTSIALCGLPKENDWILQGPFADKSQIRNALIYELGRKTGHWAPRVKFVEVILNGEYIGLYNLIEKIKRDSARVNVKKLKENEISGNDLTGGYIVKYDKGASKLQIVYPKDNDIQEAQIEYINGFFDKYEKTLFSNDGLDPEIGYKKYLDIPSFIDYTIIAEFAKNCDAYLYSSYMYKDRDDINPKIQYGPLWDFDLCFGGAYWQNGSIIDEWQFDFSSNRRFNHKRLFEDPGLVDQFQKRWFELRETCLHPDSIMNMIDDRVNTLKSPIERNYQVWPVITKSLFFDVYQVNNYEEEILHIKQWIDERSKWIDENIASIYYPVTRYESEINVPISEHVVQKIFPNPFTNEITIELKQYDNRNISVHIISVDGKVLEVIPSTYFDAGTYYIHWVSPEYLQNGLYILEIKADNQIREQYKIIKFK